MDRRWANLEIPLNIRFCRGTSINLCIIINESKILSLSWCVFLLHVYYYSYVIANLKYIRKEDNKEIRGASIARSELKDCKTILIF